MGNKKRTKVVALCLSVIAVVGAVGYWQYFATPGLPKTQVFKTFAGQEFWHFPMKDAKQSAISIVWKSNFAGLPKGLERGARIGIRLMTDGGAGGMGAADIVAEFGDLDAGSRIFAQPEYVQGFVVTVEESSKRAAELSNMVLKNPTMDKKWFKRLKRQEIKRITERIDQSPVVAWNTARRFLLGEHAYENFWSGRNYKDLENLTLEDLNRWHQQTFTKDNLMVTSAGSMDPNRIGDLIDRALEGLPAAKAAVEPILFEGLHVEGQTILVHKPDAKKTTLLLVGSLPSAKAEDRIPYFLAQGVLGVSKQSRLFKAVRGDLRAAYRFGANLDEFTKSHRVLSIFGEVDSEKLKDVLKKVEVVYQEFRTNGISLVEFPIAKKFANDFIEKQFDKPGNTAYMLMGARLEGRDEQSLSQVFEKSNNLSREKTNKIIRNNFPEFSNMLKIVVSSDRNIIDADCIIDDPGDALECRKQ